MHVRAPSHDYDVAIIGGGPAGTAAATFARQGGLRTVIVDKEAFPRFRIGESLLPQGNALLREMGVWPRLEQAGFIEKLGAFFYSADGLAEKEVIFANGIVPGLEKTFQVERARFDAILLDHARSLGAEVRLETAVRAVDSAPGGHRLTLKTAAGVETVVTARWLLDASGRDNLFPSETKRALDPSPFPKRLAIYAHFRDVARPAGIQAGHTTIVRLADGWFWIIPIDAERTSVGLVTTTEAMRRAKLPAAELFQQAVHASAKVGELMAGARPVTAFHVTSDYSYFRRELATENSLLVGDAAGFFDPIFSSGVYMAMFSAREAVARILQAHRGDRGLRRGERQRYTRLIKRHAGVFQKLIAAFYDNDSFAVFMCPHPPLGLGRGITAIVAGHAKLTWPIWWRFRAFLLICKLQRRFALVPRLDLAPRGAVVGRSDGVPARTSAVGLGA